MTGLYQCIQEGNQSATRNTIDFFQNVFFHQKKTFKHELGLFLQHNLTAFLQADHFKEGFIIAVT